MAESHNNEPVPPPPFPGVQQNCPICLSSIQDPLSLCPSRHLFCRSCLFEHLSKNGGLQAGCPVCRRTLTPAPTASPLGPTKYEQAVDALADLNFPVDRGLGLAMESNVPDLVLAFVNRGACVHGVPPTLRRRITPLMWAVTAGSVPLVIELLAGGADPNERATPDSYFPLLLAAAGGWGDILSLLLFHGADVNASMGDYHSQRRTALMAATEAGQGEIVKELCRAGAGVNAPFTLRDGTTPLMMAAARGSVPLTTTLLGAGALVNQGCTDAMGDRGRGPLAAAAGTAGSQEVTLVLLGAGAAMEAARERDGYTPLAEAVEGGHVECVRVLCQAGADVNALDSIGRSPLVIAKDNRWTSAGWAIHNVLKSFGGRYIAPRADGEQGFHQMLLHNAQVRLGGGGVGVGTR
jgi:ankyrin repeat protein